MSRAVNYVQIGEPQPFNATLTTSSASGCEMLLQFAPPDVSKEEQPVSESRFVVAVPESLDNRDAVVARVEAAGGIAVPPSQLTALIVAGVPGVRDVVRPLEEIVAATAPEPLAPLTVSLRPSSSRLGMLAAMAGMAAAVGTPSPFTNDRLSREEVRTRRRALRGSTATQDARLAAAALKRDRKKAKRSSPRSLDTTK